MQLKRVSNIERVLKEELLGVISWDQEAEQEIRGKSP